MLIVFLIIFMATVAFAVITFGFFWYETANSGYLERLRELSRQRVGRLLLKGIGYGICSQLMVILCYPTILWRKLWEPAPVPTCTLPPVLLVHGLYHNASAWVLYRGWLRRAGFTNVFAWSYSSWQHDFEELVEQLKRWITANMTRHFPGQKAIILGHSLGGLLARATVSGPEPLPCVAAIVTLGTPFQGSKLAVLGLGKLSRSLTYRGPLIQRVKECGMLEAVARLAVTSPIDNMVLPPEALLPAEPGWTHWECSPISHVAMLYHRATAAKVISYLRGICENHQEFVRE
jgi:pimeloyl-ACP methyl ester carboxylesterase